MRFAPQPNAYQPVNTDRLMFSPNNPLSDNHGII